MTSPSAGPRPFRFMADAVEVVDGRHLAEKAKRAEGLGYDALVLTDHLIDQLAPIPAMATIAAATERLRIGTFVINNDLRHPAVLAQDLATLDVLSSGRLIVGLGAGWNVPEYRAAGIAFEPVASRVDRLAEAVTVLKGLFAPEPFSFHGRHYEISEMDGRPKPVQQPHPPFLIGGGGRRLLSMAGREAQIVGLAPRIGASGRSDVSSVLASATEEKIGWVREAAGDRFGELELNTYPSVGRVTVTDQPRQSAEALLARLHERSGFDGTVEDLLESPHVYIGSIDGLVEKFRSLRERFGISSIMVGELGPLDEVVERLAGT